MIRSRVFRWLLIGLILTTVRRSGSEDTPAPQAGEPPLPPDALRRIQPKDYVYSVVFSPDGKTLASVSDHTTRLWDVATGKPIRTLTGHHKKIRCLAFAPDGKTLASGGDKGVLVWKNPAAKPRGK